MYESSTTLTVTTVAAAVASGATSTTTGAPSTTTVPVVAAVADTLPVTGAAGVALLGLIAAASIFAGFFLLSVGARLGRKSAAG